MYYVYILTNRSGTLYAGITNDLPRRLAEHRGRKSGSFVSRYGVTRLVLVEPTHDVHAALRREKQIKGWVRRRKIDLINAVNPDWLDLAGGALESVEAASTSPPEPDPSLRSG